MLGEYVKSEEDSLQKLLFKNPSKDTHTEKVRKKNIMSSKSYKFVKIIKLGDKAKVQT